MKIPFLNRQKYIVLRCYTDHAGVAEKSPITKTYDQNVKTPNPDPFYNPVQNFSTCWSRYATRKSSATILAPTAFRYKTDGKGRIEFNEATNLGIVTVSFDHDKDESYGTNKDTFLTKINLPWQIEEKTGASFITARHMHNTTMMNVLSGLVSFKASPSINVFNMINKVAHQYEVPFLTPMISLYPMSELPLHIESYYDKDKFQELNEKGYKPQYRATAIKRAK